MQVKLFLLSFKIYDSKFIYFKFLNFVYFITCLDSDNVHNK